MPRCANCGYIHSDQSAVDACYRETARLEQEKRDLVNAARRKQTADKAAKKKSARIAQDLEKESSQSGNTD